jgi:hypothetical protein
MLRLSKRKGITLAIIALSFCFFSLGFVTDVLAIPSDDFIYRNGMWYDSWNITRNAWFGEDGYLPKMAYESLGVNRELAYGWGQEFKAAYPDKVERAQEIMTFVQRWMKYGHDGDYVIKEGEAQVEWAWNADEMAYKIDEAKSSYSVARGDCEDFAFLCGVMYLGAEFEVALVGPEGHVALLIWFPEYPDASIYWDIGDGKGYGWIWVEATGDNNPLGWTPSDFRDGRFDVYVIREDLPFIDISEILFEPKNPTPESDVIVTVRVRTWEAEVSQVNLVYYMEGETARNAVPMNLTGESTYQGTIPKQSGGTTINFYVQASDTLGRSVNSYEVSYKVETLIFGLNLEILTLGIIVAGVIILILIFL